MKTTALSVTQTLLPKNKAKKNYRKPRLEHLGDLRTSTLGGSAGINDFSGNFNTKSPGSLPQQDFFNPNFP